MPAARIRIGVSSCLIGTPVRYDGRHKRNAFVADVLARHVELVPVCPELELGLGVPREPIRLVGRAAAPRLVGERSGRDHTAAMRAFARARVAALAREGLSGFVTKKDSPSCGMERVRLHPERGGPPRRDGVGAFARELLAALPLLPVEEEGRLEEPALRESFLERVFAYARWRRARPGRMTRGGLVAFHAAHELLLRAHGPAACRRLDRLVAGAGAGPLGPVLEAYGAGLMTVLRTPATRGRHAAVLRHVAGHLRGLLADGAREELEEAIGEYARGRVPLIVPQALLLRHARRHRVACLAGQVYLDPDPRERALRSGG